MSLAHADSASIHTRNGSELGMSVSSYLYEEPALMSNKGDKFGLNHFGVKTLDDVWFVKDDVRFAFGSVGYSSPKSGTKSNVADWYIDVRGLLGRDIQVGDVMYSPFVGLGYRFLFNDLRGYTSRGSVGYRRESNYLYIPIGLTHRFSLQDAAVLATTFEYDHLLKGKQISKLSDTGLVGYTDVSNDQHRGFGLRAEIMYTMHDLAFGPFLATWNINDSDLVQGGLEPYNRTTEFGLRMRFRF